MRELRGSCKALAKGLGKSRHRRDYEIMWGWRRQGRGRGDMGKRPSKGEQLAVGSKGNFFEGKGKGQGKGTKGKGKVQASEDLSDVFRNRVLQLHYDFSWHYRAGIAVTLPHLLLSLGEMYTAADLYGYFNTLEPLCVKRPHAWTNPVRQAAAHQRWQHNKWHGRGFGRYLAGRFLRCG